MLNIEQLKIEFVFHKTFYNSTFSLESARDSFEFARDYFPDSKNPKNDCLTEFLDEKQTQALKQMIEEYLDDIKKRLDFNFAKLEYFESILRAPLEIVNIERAIKGLTKLDSIFVKQTLPALLKALKSLVIKIDRVDHSSVESLNNSLVLLGAEAIALIIKSKQVGKADKESEFFTDLYLHETLKFLDKFKTQCKDYPQILEDQILLNI